MNQIELFILGVVSLFIWWIITAIEIPLISFFIGLVGWLIPVAFFYGAWEKGKPSPPKF